MDGPEGAGTGFGGRDSDFFNNVLEDEGFTTPTLDGCGPIVIEAQMVFFFSRSYPKELLGNRCSTGENSHCAV